MAERHVAALLEAKGSEFKVSGELTFATVAPVLEPGRRAIGAVQGARAVLDLSAVTRADSAGLALVVDWMRTARARDIDLELRAVSPQLAAIAMISGLEDLIPAGDSNVA